MTGSPSRIPRPPRPRRLWFPGGSVRPDAVAAAPEPSSATRPSRPSGARYGALLAFALVGCTETGDFGRPKLSFLNDVVLPSAGSLAAQARGEPVSLYVHTDDEDELRDRAWRFVMPAHERSWFEGIIAELVRTRVLPAGLQPADRSTYYHALMGGSFRSPASRYRRLSEDAVADLRLIGPFAAVAARVITADGVRLRSLAHVRDLAEIQVHDAVARVAENRCLIAWVRHEMLARLASYRYALERLLIEAPQPEAAAAERALVKLEVHRATLDTLAGPPLPHGLCDGDAEVHVDSATVIVPRQAPLVVKN
jgi:hypothetical protein